MNKNDKKTLKQMLPMSLCCLLPIVFMLLAPTIAIYSPVVSKFMYLISPFICPLLMGGMILFMSKSNNKNNYCK